MYHGERVPGFPQHPHRGFETVTVVRRGLVDHSDSLGAQARYGEGDVQWLTAGAGIQHAEMFPLLHRDRDNPLELFQIWLNLPAADKMAPPHFTMFWADAVPTVSPAAGVSVTLVAGALDGVVAALPAAALVRVEGGQRRGDLDDPACSRRVVDAAARRARIEPVPLLLRGQRGCTWPGSPCRSPRSSSSIPMRRCRSRRPAAPIELLLLQGRPIAEPVAQYGPFVMNTRAELQQAFADYQRTQFGGWPWGAADPVNGREGRFARQPDGTVERPD